MTDDGSLVLDDLRIGPIDAAIGPLGVNGLQIDYARATQEWKGQGELCVVVACLDARAIPGEAPPGGVLIRHGQLVRAYANLNFPDPGSAFAGVQPQPDRRGIGLGPPRFLGGARLTALGILRIDGALVLALPTTAEPFFLTREENGDAFPANFYGRPYNRFTLALGADASLKVPIIDDPIALAKAYFLYEAPGYVAFGGGVHADFIDVLSLSGGVDGEFNAENGRFNLSGHIRACVADVVCAGAIAYLSSVGVGGCVTLDALFADINVGGGVVYNPFDIKLWPFDGCRWTRFKDDHVFTARAAQAGGGAMTVHIAAGQRSRAVALDSSDGAARVRVTGPGGMIAETPAGPGLTLKPKVRIMRSEKLHQTVVGLVDPAPGDYRIEVLPDSPAITNVSEATDPPPAQVTAHVRGPRRAADARLRHRPPPAPVGDLRGGQRRRPRPIGTVSGGRGTLSFTPAPGKDLRHVVAQFSLDGIRTETKTVASFRPPSPFLARPGHLRVRRRGSSLRVSWAPVAGAARYEVVTTTGSAGQRITRARGAHATRAQRALTSAGRVSVRAVAPMRQGSARIGTLRRHETTQDPVLPTAEELAPCGHLPSSFSASWRCSPRAAGASRHRTSRAERARRRGYGRLPQSFAPNRGLADRRYGFLSRGPGYALALRPDSASLALSRHDARAAVRIQPARRAPRCPRRARRTPAGHGQQLPRQRPVALAHRDPHLRRGRLPVGLSGRRRPLPRRPGQPRVRLHAGAARATPCDRAGLPGRARRRADRRRATCACACPAGRSPSARRSPSRVAGASRRATSSTAGESASRSGATTTRARSRSIRSCSPTRPTWAAAAPSRASASRSTPRGPRT